MRGLLRTGVLRVSSVGGKGLFFAYVMLAANHLHRLFFPIHPSVRKNRVIFSLEKYKVFEVSPISSCRRLLVAQCVKELLEIGLEQPWVCRWLCHQAPPGWGLKLGNDKAVSLQLLRFQSLFWFNVATKGKAFECCLQHKRVLKYLILDSVGEDQPKSCQMWNGWRQFCVTRAETGLYFICPAFFFNTALLASEEMTFLLCWPKKAT